MQTKSCLLTEDEITLLIQNHGSKLFGNIEERMDRINYLHKRLKAFKEPELTEVKSTNTAAGWGTDVATQG